MAIDLTPHHQQLADEGYTIVEHAIEPDLVDVMFRPEPADEYLLLWVCS